MYTDKCRSVKTFFLCVLGFVALFPLAVLAEETPVMSIEAAKSAIENARKAGAEQTAADDLSTAKSWLSRAEQAYAAANSMMAKLSTAKTKKAKEDEVMYLAGMAKAKGLTAEAKAKKYTTTAELKDTQKDLTDYQSAIAVMKEKMEEAEKAKEIQAKAKVERKQLEESQRMATELEARKRKELEEAQRKTADLEALKQKELKESAEAKMKDTQVNAQRTKEALEMKEKEEKFSAERRKLAALQTKLEALEQEKAMFADSTKIPKVTAKAGDKKIIMTILAVDLFTPANDIGPAGKKILDGVGKFLKAYPKNKVVIQGHTDNRGKATDNQTVSVKRAQKVREYLVAYQNILPDRISAEGMGSAKAVATNASEAGRALNRRVELNVLMGD